MLTDDLHSRRPSRDEVFLARVREILDASARGDTGKVRELLRDDAALANAKGTHDKTPLHLAGEMNHADVANVLVDAGADRGMETTWGMTPLEWSATMGSADAARELMAPGTRLNLYVAAALGMLDEVRSFWGEDGALRRDLPQLRCVDRIEGSYVRTTAPEDDADVIGHAFYIACRNGHNDVAQFLLSKGADINTRGFFGGTALHWAAFNGHADTVTFLIDHGADPNLKDERWDSTPAGYAMEEGHEGVGEYLRKYEIGNMK